MSARGGDAESPELDPLREVLRDLHPLSALHPGDPVLDAMALQAALALKLRNYAQRPDAKPLVLGAANEGDVLHKIFPRPPYNWVPYEYGSVIFEMTYDGQPYSIGAAFVAEEE